MKRWRVSGPMDGKLAKWLLPVAVLAALIGAWQVAASSGALADLLGLEPFLVPSPAEIASALWDNRSLLAENAWVTLREVLVGFLIALVAGVSFATLLRLSTTLRYAFYPLLIASQAVPIVVFAPILVIWFGFGIGPKLAIVALICFFPITVATLDGMRSVDPEATKMMRSLDASRWQVLWRVEGPTALPSLFSGARIAAVFAPIGAVFGEWAGADSGLGHMILLDNGQLETAREFAAAFVLIAIALALFALLALAERRVVSWR
jgi:ABC-type nitrate/sulfonate/bicarbonate transport system permease component